MKLLLVDDHALFREGLRTLLLKISPEVTIYEAATVDAAVDECRSTQFRMVLLDLQLSRSEGMETLDSFRGSVPDVPVVVLSGSEEPQRIRAAIERGAVGYVPKSHTSELMIAALRLVLSGGVYLPPNLLEPSVDLARATDATGAQPFARLSPRQHEVAQLLLQGQPNKVIARQLGLSEGTIKAHVSAIYQIIGAKNRLEAVTLAAKSGIAVM